VPGVLPVRLWLAALVWLMLGVAAWAQDRVQLQATNEDGFGRLVLEFSDRMDLPPYKISYDNNVLAITFDAPVSMTIPDMSTTLPNYTTIGRLDPDGRGVRFGLRSAATIHSMEAGEKLFVDLMPAGWQGLPPSLPPEVVAELVKRAKDAAIIAEQKRKAEEAKALNPTATIQIGRNPTFYRVEVDWSVDTKATYKQDGTTAGITFDWPVPIDLYALKADLPPEIQSTNNSVTTAGSAINFTLADGVTPRFYAVDGKHFTFDIDLSEGEIDANRTTAEAAAKKADLAAAAVAATKIASAAADPASADDMMSSDYSPVGAITPVVDDVSARCASRSRSNATRPRRCSGAATRCGCCSTPRRGSISRSRRRRCRRSPRRSRSHRRATLSSSGSICRRPSSRASPRRAARGCCRSGTCCSTPPSR
jgi:hypothetical protein